MNESEHVLHGNTVRGSMVSNAMFTVGFGFLFFWCVLVVVGSGGGEEVDSA